MTTTRITASRGALIIFAAMALLAFNATAPRAQAPATAKKQAQPAVKAPARHGETVRTLDAINIEGEIAVPQVLFITARDVRRYRDGLGLKFQLSASEAGRSAVLPSRLRVAPQQQSQKEE